MRITLVFAAVVTTAALAFPVRTQESQPAAPPPEADVAAETDLTAEADPAVEADPAFSLAELPPTEIVVPGVRKLVISGQYRLRYEAKLNFDFNDDAGASNDFFGQRVRLNIAPEFTDQIRGLIQLQDARDWGEEMNTLDDDADGLDLHQAWVEIDEFPGINGSARIGRQTVDLGSARLVSSLEWANQGRSFDGIVHRWKSESESELTAFFLQTREIINITNDDQYFTGLFGTVHPTETTTVDLYGMFLRNDETMAGGTESRFSLGSRVLQDVGDLELGVEYVTQVGEMDNNDIPIGETYALAAHAIYRFDHDAKPWVKVEFNLASGDDPNTSDVERFNTLFPFAHYYLGYMDLALWENLQHVTAEVGGKITDDGTLKGAWHFFRAMEETDRFGGPSGQISGGMAGRSRTMGNEVDVVYTHLFPMERIKLGLEVGAGLFVPGAGAKQAAGSDDLAQFVYVQGDLRF